MKKNKWLSHSIEETQQIACDFALELKPGSVICLHGPLGAGKTAFAKALIHSLTGASYHAIQSPTFSYVIEYGENPIICHFDLYRLSHPEEFTTMGFEEYFDSSHISIIEWAERIESILPEDHRKIYLSYEGDESRSIELL